jgi:hypothetical protein
MKFRIKLLLYVKAHKRLSLCAERGSTLSLFEKRLLKVTLAAGYTVWNGWPLEQAKRRCGATQFGVVT